MGIDELINNKFYWEGPKWLKIDELNWENFEINDLEILKEAKKEALKYKKINPCVNLNICETNQTKAPFLIDINKYSSLKKLLNVTTWCLRFINNIKGKNIIKNELLINEKFTAKLMWEKHTLELFFSEIYQNIKENKKSFKNYPPLFIDENNLIRCGGRLEFAQLTYNEINPKLLPYKSKFTELVILDAHNKSYHCGTSYVLAKIRLEYWIEKGRTLTKKTIKKCYKCKRIKAKPYCVPEFPPYPENRVNALPAFSYVGVDYMGPFSITNNSNKIKVWVCLYTCLIVRAIHMEVVQNLRAEEFLLCHRRFVFRRGNPIEIISDNATQFVLSATIIKEYLLNNNIAWKNITAFAPLKGGVYKRVIGLVKKCLEFTFYKNKLTEIEFTTLICEIENIINNRPLTYIDSDTVTRSITPNDFIILNPKRNTCCFKKPKGIEDIDITENNKLILKNWEIGNKILNKFWNLWKLQYLLSLRENRQLNLKQSNHKSDVNPNVGDIVIVHDQGDKREWKLAKILELT